jgi:transcription elongation factor GreA
MPEAEKVTISEAVTRFLATSPAQRNPEYPQQIQKFLRWAGRDRVLSEMTPRQVESYTEANAGETAEKLAAIRAFLAYANKSGITPTNLGVHLKAKKVSSRGSGARGTKPVQKSQLTKEGYDKAVVELEELKGHRVVIADEIRKAMADKDFRENAPLDAARDKQGHLEARIRELEHILRHAVTIDDAEPADTRSESEGRCRVGSKIVVKDMTFNEEIIYQIVHPNEVNLRLGRISAESPTGRAFMDKRAGEVVQVTAPGGVHNYRIQRIE